MISKESNRDKFIRLANSRVNETIKKLELIGNLSNRSNYDYDDSDIDKIFAVLQAELRASKERFQKAQKGKEKKFSL
jgi:hypothetical protein